MIEIRQCETDEDRAAATGLMAQLGAWDSAETEKLGFSAEDVLDFYYSSPSDALDDLLPPFGLTLLGYVGSEVAGCIAYRRLDADICEMKRLYVRPGFRQAGLGRAIISALIERACQAGYAQMRLETVVFMSGAVRMYEDMGFVRRAPYYNIPESFLPITIFMENNLGNSDRSAVAA